MKVAIEEIQLAELKPQKLNARYMRQEQFQQLVANLKLDGVLTSTPLVYRDDDGDHIISGHHRVRAGLAAGIVAAPCLVIVEPKTLGELRALQISHNAISGEDDPATLKLLYEEIDDADLRQYTGLDDKMLDLMQKVDLTSLSEANLDFSTISLVFLPHELAAAEEALRAAMEVTLADERWMAGYRDYDRTLSALEKTHKAYKVGNVATALGIILSMFERHQMDLQEGWLEDGAPVHTGDVPMASVFGRDTLKSESAAIIAKAVNGEEDPWALIERLCAEHLKRGEEDAHE